MKLQKLHIKNYKSLVDLEIVEPNPFTVFAGPNGAGKSNIFEALEFGKFVKEWNPESAVRLFGGNNSIISRSLPSEYSYEGDNIIYEFPDVAFNFDNKKGYSVKPERYLIDGYEPPLLLPSVSVKENKGILEKEATSSQLYSYRQFIESFSRVFIKNSDLVRVKEISDEKLSLDCSNLETVLKRLLENEIKREDITEYLELFIPGFEKMEISSDNLSGTDTLLIHEKGVDKPFTKDLISDGTYNIICLLTAVFQSDEPQFLCIEEPENGLNPHVIETFVDLFRSICEDNKHYIWLNTHSQTLIRGLKEKELILVDKKDGVTKIKQFKKGAFYGLRADEAWLSNALGAGLPW